MFVFVFRDTKCVCVCVNGEVKRYEMVVTKKDINLAEQVRRFPALYDKTKKEFKDKNVTSFVWSNVANHVKLQSVRLLSTSQ